jgi:hypothetical protein
MATKWWISTSSTSFNTAGNWSDGVAPASSDTLIYNYLGTANCETNLGTSLTGVTVIVEKSYSGQIGSITAAGVATYLALDGFTAYIGQRTGAGSPTGSQLVLLSNTGSNATVINIFDTPPTSSTNFYPPFLTKGAALTINHSGGIIGVAVIPGETAGLTLNVAKGSGQQSPVAYLGAGVTAAAITINNGQVDSRSDNTTASVILSDGNSIYNFQGTGAHTAASVDSGTFNHAGIGTITTLNLTGTFNRDKDTRALTVTTLNFYRGAMLNVDNGKSGSTTITNKNLVRCGMQDVRWQTPEGDLF